MGIIKKSEDVTLLWSDKEGDLRKKKKDVKELDVIPSEISLYAQIEKKNRGGKVVTVIKGFPVAPTYLKKLGKKVRKKLSVGGTSTDSTLEFQGDVRVDVLELLCLEGFSKK